MENEPQEISTLSMEYLLERRNVLGTEIDSTRQELFPLKGTEHDTSSLEERLLSKQAELDSVLEEIYRRTRIQSK